MLQVIIKNNVNKVYNFSEKYGIMIISKKRKGTNMSVSDMIICILFTTFAASYAWGMRGTVMGGEKGAMLPGAFIGLILAWFSGGAIRENFWIPAAAGLMGMTFGGTEPYGETIGMVLHRGRPDHNPAKGYFGLAFKGALWFSICGGFIAISLASMSKNIYKTSDLVVFMLLVPAIQQTGYRVFNQPYDKEKGIYPKIFYSLTRREEWGSNLALLIAMLAFAVIRGDDFTLAMIAGGFFFGAVGWLVAMKFYVLSAFPMKNGKYILGMLSEKKLVDGWKIMEFTLGAIGGFGLALTYCVRFVFVEKYNEAIALGGVRTLPVSLEKFMPFICILLSLGIVGVNLYAFICDRKNKRVNSFVCDLIERPLYNVIPMIFVLLGSQFTAKYSTVFILVFVLAVKCFFDRFPESKLLPLAGVILTSVCALVFAGCFYPAFCTPSVIIIIGTVPYLITELICVIWKAPRMGRTATDVVFKTPFITVYPFMVLQSILIIIFSIKKFII